jgi:ABC-type sugar transport system substrate-binding protein
MAKLRFLISLLTNDNDYQVEQAKVAEATAMQLGIELEILYAGNDAVTQSTQILQVIQGDPEKRPHGIICEPVGSAALPAAARAAVKEGIGWAVLNRNVEYIAELRRTSKVPAFGVSSDHIEVGRIQARQCAALLPGGGTILCIQGPSESTVAKERLIGLQEAKPANIHMIALKGQWTEDSALRAVKSWLRLQTSKKANIDLFVAQNDAMAIGVRKALQESLTDLDRERWLQRPFLGVDAVPKTGQTWLRSGLLTATVFTPPNTAPAIELLVDALRNGRMPAPHVLIAPSSMPSIDKLHPRS